MATDTVPSRRAPGALPWELPRGAQLAIALELCERFGFYSLLSLLALFLSADRSAGGFGWDRTPALTLLGVYSGLMYALPVFGGWVADRLLGHRRALIVGGSMMCLGYVLLMSPALLPRVLEVFGHPGATARLAGISAALGSWQVPAGLAPDAAHLYLAVTAAFWSAIVLLIAGNSLFKSTLVVVLGDSFEGDDGLRETAYAWYYTSINVGGLIAGFVAGAVAVAYGWAAAFGVSAFAVGAALAAYAGLSGGLPRHRAHAGRAASAAPADLHERAGTRLLILAVFAGLLLIYSIGSFQLYGVMSLFLEHNVDRRVGSFNIPTQWFTSVDSAALIIAAPAFAALWTWLARRGREPDILHKYAIALALGAAGLLLFAIVAWPRAASSGAPGWILPAIGITVQATGEVAAWTASYGLVYRLAPKRWVAAVMGAFYASTLGSGAYLAGVIGRFAQPWGEGNYFLVFGLVTAGAALVALLIGAPLRRLAASSGAALRVRTGQ